MRLRGAKVAATDRLPLGTLMALAAWPIWLLIAR
jgi:leader peptidase (prepilin peptidase) / N-methyltransferase